MKRWVAEGDYSVARKTLHEKMEMQAERALAEAREAGKPTRLLRVRWRREQVQALWAEAMSHGISHVQGLLSALVEVTDSGRAFRIAKQ